MADPRPDVHYVHDDGIFPNSRLPVLLWRQGITMKSRTGNGPESIERRFVDHGWQGTWQNGIFTFHSLPQHRP